VNIKSCGAVFAGAVAVPMLAAVNFVATTPAHATTPVRATTHATAAVRSESTRTLLRQLNVGIEHPAGYQRTKFPLWDSQGGGCDTRDRVLITEAVVKPDVSSTCELTGGRWRSPYDGIRTRNPSTFDVDHLVPLAEAWQSGAWRWSTARREAYANDLGYGPDLVAVSAHANRSKGDSEPSEYLPPRTAFDCRYEAWWVAVKWRWQLKVDASEKSWLARHLRRCGWPRVTAPSRPGSSGPHSSRGGARITTVYFDSPGSDQGTNSSINAEYVRIKNTSRHRITLTGWTVHDSGKVHNYRFGRLTLDPSATVTLHSGVGHNGPHARYWGEHEYVWNNDGDRATLANAVGRRVDSCGYTAADDPQVRC
jgi:Lamin Tail Domain/Protein of unknown function (DUF1524)